MKVSFKFFDNERWSVSATMITGVALVMFWLFGIRMDLRMFVLCSLIGMMSGDLVSKIVFGAFLGIGLGVGLGVDWRKIVAIIGAIVLGDVVSRGKWFGVITDKIVGSYLAMKLFQIVIFGWMIGIGYIVVTGGVGVS